ncbi:MAG TPA: NUDIX domain-containing protein [Patescibacteria group bacterium]|nr:NUDIX domain-containing protein [Patescibacteria group bacterium]
MFKNILLIGGAVVVKVLNGKFLWLIVKNAENNGWELPKVVVRKTESSVRAVIRTMGEQGSMRAKVLEEVGRINSTVKKGDKVINQKQIFYLMLHRADSGESIGFSESEWLENTKASKKLNLKREVQILRDAGKMFKSWFKERKGKLRFAEDEQAEQTEY